MSGRDEDANTLAVLDAGEPFNLLDCSLGYAGTERRVGYIRADAVEGSVT